MAIRISKDHTWEIDLKMYTQLDILVMGYLRLKCQEAAEVDTETI